jgi:hypothetical protein
MSDDPEPARDQFKELLQELRVVLPGVQVLLGFLLTVPFDARFELLADLSKAMFGLAVAAGVVGVVLLIAPTTQHRRAWRSGSPDYGRLLPMATTEALLGMAAVAISMVAGTFVVFDLVYHAPLAGLVAGVLVAFIAWLWFLTPVGTSDSHRRAG